MEAVYLPSCEVGFFSDIDARRICDLHVVESE